jgi:hypothetical protein
MISCQRAYKWGIKHGYIDRSPIDLLEKPTPKRKADFRSGIRYGKHDHAIRLENRTVLNG